MKGIYSFRWVCGSLGDLTGLFVADSEDVKNIVGKHVYFGEVLGEHSEIAGTIDAGDIVLETDDQEFIAKFESIFGESFVTGYNPLDYYDPLDDYDLGEEEDED